MKSNKKTTDEELMKLFIKGDKRAFDELYERYAKKLLFFLYTKLHRDADKANDFLQDLFLKLIENPRAFDTKKRFSTWFYNVAYNMCKNEYKKNSLRGFKVEGKEMESIPYKDETTDSFDQQKLNQFNWYLSKELERLDENQRSTFILKFKENFTINEISNIMECSPGTVKSRLFYTIKKLSTNLKEHNPSIQ